MGKSTTLEVCRKHLYSDPEDVPGGYKDKIVRIRVGYSYWYEFPTKSEADVRDHLINEFKCAKATAYEDLQIIKILLGDVKNPTKDFIRFQVNAMLDAAYKLAEIQKDPKAMAMAAAHKAKYNMLDIPDAEQLPFDQIAVQQFEPTDDPTPLGLLKDPDIREKKRKMLEKYSSEIEIVDVPYEELDVNSDDREEEDIL